LNKAITTTFGLLEKSARRRVRGNDRDTRFQEPGTEDRGIPVAA